MENRYQSILQTGILQRGEEAFRKMESRFGQRTLFKKRVPSEKDQSLCFYLLHTHCASGISLPEALEAVEKEMLGKVELHEARVLLKKGVSVAQSMDSFCRKDRFAYMTLKVGEQTGNLISSLQLLHQYYQRRYIGKQEIAKLLFYPAIILANLLFVVLFLGTVILPGIEELYEAAEVAMPAFPSTLLYGVRFISLQQKWIFLFLSGICLGIDLIGRWEKGRKYFEELPWRVPGIAGILQKLFLKRFSWMFASLLKAGVDEIAALEAIVDMERMPYIVESIEKILQDIRKGKRTSQALMEYPKLFDTLYVLYLRQGEEVQALNQHAQVLATMNEENIQRFIANLIRFGQPLLILLLGLLIGAVLLTLLPLLDVTSLYGNF